MPDREEMTDENLNGLTIHDIDAMHRQADTTPFPCLLRDAMEELKESRDLRTRLAALKADLEARADAADRRARHSFSEGNSAEANAYREVAADIKAKVLEELESGKLQLIESATPNPEHRPGEPKV